MNGFELARYAWKSDVYAPSTVTELGDPPEPEIAVTFAEGARAAFFHVP